MIRKDPGMLDDTNMSKTPIYEFKCDKCERSFEKRIDLKGHDRHYSITGGVLEGCMCKLCNKTLRSTQQVREHFKLMHTGVKMLMCKKCDKTFNTQQDLMKHMETTHTRREESMCRMSHSKKRSFACKTCSKGFRTGEELEDHPERGHFAEVANKCMVCRLLPYTCKVCQKGLREEMKFEKQLTKANATKGSFECKMCDKTFRSAEEQTKHKAAHYRIAVAMRSVECNACNEMFSVRAIDNDGKTYKCKTCVKACQMEEILKQQGKSNHTNHFRVVNCKGCDKPIQKGERCELCDEGKEEPVKPDKNNSIRLASLNINRGLNRKQDLIQATIEHYDCGVVALHEVELKDSVTFALQGFQTFYPKKNEVKRSILLVKEEIEAIERTDIMSDSITSIWIEVKGTDNRKILMGTYYREFGQLDGKGQDNINDQIGAWKEFEAQVAKATAESGEVVCMGDFNIDRKRLKDDTYYLMKLGKRYEALLDEHNLTDFDYGYTWMRISQDGKVKRSALDQCITNSKKLILNIHKIEIDYSDHSAIVADIQTGPKAKKRGKVFTRDLRQIRRNPEMFQQMIANIRWEEMASMSGVDEMEEFYSQEINKVLDILAPVKARKIVDRPGCKLSNETRREMRRKEEMKKRIDSVCNTNGLLDNKVISQYRKQRNLCNRMVKKDFEEQCSVRISEESSMGEIWRSVGHILKPERASRGEIKIDNGKKLLAEPGEIAEELNQFFKSKIDKLALKIQKDNSDPLERLRNKVKDMRLTFELRTIKEGDVRKVIKKLKNKRSHGFDNISAELIKLAGESIIQPLTWIVNTSIVTGVFPKNWKKAKVTPLFKKGDRTLAKNYRPVSLLSVSGMVLERITAIQIDKYFEDNNLFGDFQFGFRQNKSTVSELLTLFDSLMTAKDKKKEIALVMYDLSAAFDTVSPAILLEKLKLYGFKKKAMEWITSYLSERKQAVVMQGKISTMIDLELGTPQGSRLSPLLFVILMADLDLWIERSDLVNFADDTQSSVIEDSQEEMIRTVQEESRRVTSFFAGVNLVNNADKAALLYNSKRRGCNITIEGVGGETLTSVHTEKLLGLHISASLDWREHIEKVCKALKQRLGILRRLKYKVPKSKLQIIAEAIFTSKIRYGLAVYGNPRTSEGETEDTEMKSLQVLQNDMIRLINGYTRSDHINMKELRAKTRLLSVNQLSVYHTVLEVYNVVWNNSSMQLKKKMQKMQGSAYVTRSEVRGDLPIPTKPSEGCLSFSYKGPKLWNLVPKHIREETEQTTFKAELKAWIMKEMPD